MSQTQNPLDAFRATVPPVFARADVVRLFGGIITRGTLANEDSKGRGPAGRFYVGRRTCYEREAFLAWLEGRLSNKSTRNPAKENQAKRLGA